jgi:antibiotic biosynthesis monooxygenase (ABM) superfamily enzyme
MQPDWVVVYRFGSITHLQAWINSATRQDRLAAGQRYLEGPGTQQVVGGGASATDRLVTVIVTHRVNPEQEQEFIEWQRRMREAESTFEGFRGTELFRPIADIQDEWTAIYRYSSPADLDRWLTSQKRQQLLAEGEKFRDFQSRIINNSFGSWFAFNTDGNDAPPPSDIKTSLAVWVGLYPTVVLLSLALSPLKLPLWQGLMIGNLFSSFTMTFVTMPYYANRLLKWWLWPSPDTRAKRANLRAMALVVFVQAFWVVLFYLVTKKFWHLP